MATEAGARSTSRSRGGPRGTCRPWPARSARDGRDDGRSLAQRSFHPQEVARMVASPIEASLWHATAVAPPTTAPLDGEMSADVCVVGAGYTGLSSALHLGGGGGR